MFENIINFFKGMNKKNDNAISSSSKDTAKERLHLVLMQDRANVSADFLELMKQEIIEVIKKYIDVDENEIDVRLTNKENSDGTNGAPALYANIPIKNIKNDVRKMVKDENKSEKLEQETKKSKTKIEDKSSEKEIKVPSLAENKKKEKQAEQKVEQAEEIIEEVETSKNKESESKAESSTKTESKKDTKTEKKEDKSENENGKTKVEKTETDKKSTKK